MGNAFVPTLSRNMHHHPVFDRFMGYDRSRPESIEIDFIGTQFPAAWWGYDVPAQPRGYLSD